MRTAITTELGRHGPRGSATTTASGRHRPTALANLGDPSALLVPAVEWAFEQHALLRVGAYLPLGQGVDTAFLASADPAVALRTLGARSEYGLSSYGAFVQVGLYFN